MRVHAVKIFLLGAYFVVLRGMKVVKVAVGSLNPVKIRSSQEGMRKALAPVFGDEPFEIVVKGFNSPSEVSDQPMGDKETKLGAQNRARNAWAAYQREEETEPDYSVGLEGGVTLEDDDEMICSAYMAVTASADGVIGTARTCSFALPDAIKEKVKSGMELGDADDAVFGSTNSKQKGGTVGHLTRGSIDRSAYYVDAVCLACIPLLWPDFWK
jgi:inosine/xanthosine triphosphatase